MAPCLSNLQRVGVALAVLSVIEEKKKKKKRIWIKRWLKERQNLSHVNLINLLDFEDTHNFLRMEKETFYQLLELVRPFITKTDTHLRQAVSAEERLLVTLRYLTTGTCYKDLRYSFLISQQLLSKIIPETCRAIYKVLKNTIQIPSTKEEWEASAKLFEEQWNFNNCVGCMDGKHILIVKPSRSGSIFYNYKGTFSVVLFAVVNANYEFIYVHTGSNGSMSDGGIIKNTRFYNRLMNNELNLPEAYKLPGTEISVPYVFLGDSAFALDTHIMKPYPERNITKEQRIFNYRLCRARRIVENAFGILASRFKVFKQPINLSLENIDIVVLACCSLHNFLRKHSNTYLTSACVDREEVENGTLNVGTWRQAGAELTPLQINIQRPTNDGKRIRNTLMEYFNGVGSVPFQNRMANIP